MKRMAQIQQVDSNINCNMCEKEKRSNIEPRNHKSCRHGNEEVIVCDLCAKKTYYKHSTKDHIECDNRIQKGSECNLCELKPNEKNIQTYNIQTHQDNAVIIV